ncbi:MAG: TRAM domain-containing protein [Microthrixaceae bacterium]
MNRTDPLDLVTTGVAVGGAGIARDGDGRVVFVEGALVGERVSVEIVETKKSFRRGRVLDVLEPAPGRVLPSCPEIANGCGGCDLAHASHAAQREMKAAMVADSLRRLGRLADLPDIDPGPDLATTGFRTTIRAAVVDGRAGLRHRRSHDVVTVASCEVAHPVVEGMLVDGRYGDADEVTIRVGANTGEQAVFVGGSEPDEGTVIHEEIAGRRFRISPRSFFQTRADGAAALVSVVDEAIGPDPTGTLVDLCSGVGLFAATIGDRFDRVVTVESNRSSVADARVNLAHLGDRVAVRSSTFERWTPEPADVVIADPSRAGLGREGVANVAATGAPLMVLISCDAGSLGRDAGLLTAAGYRLDAITLVDLFPNTAHVEVVSTYRR